MLRRTSRFGRQKRLRRGQWVMRCPLWWSRTPSLAVSGRHEGYRQGRFLNSPGPRPASLAMRSRTSPSSSAVQKQSEAISHILPRRSTAASTPPPAAPQPARAEGDSLRLPPLPRRSSSLHPSAAVELVVSVVPSPSRPPPRGAAKPRARGPRTGDPEMVGTALQEMVAAPLLPPE